jgi:hypothetical protein
VYKLTLEFCIGTLDKRPCNKLLEYFKHNFVLTYEGAQNVTGELIVKASFVTKILFEESEKNFDIILYACYFLYTFLVLW